MTTIRIKCTNCNETRVHNSMKSKENYWRCTKCGHENHHAIKTSAPVVEKEPEVSLRQAMRGKQ